MSKDFLLAIAGTVAFLFILGLAGNSEYEVAVNAETFYKELRGE